MMIDRYSRNLPADFSPIFGTEGNSEFEFGIRPMAPLLGTRCLLYCAQQNSIYISHVRHGRVHRIDFDNGVMTFHDHHRVSVRDMEVTGGDQELIASSWDGTVSVSSAGTLQLRLLLTEEDMGRCPNTIVSKDLKYAASQSYDSDKNPLPSNRVRLFEMVNGSLVWKVSLLGHHLSSLRCGSNIFTGSYLCASSNTGYIQILDYLNGGETLYKFLVEDELHSMYHMEESNIILVGSRSGTLYGLDLNEFSVRPMFTNYSKSDVMFLTGTVINKQQLIFSVSCRGEMNILKMTEKGLELISSINVFRNYLWTVTCLNHKNLLLVSGEEGDIWVYSIADLENIHLVARLVIFSNSYTFFPVDQPGFFSTNPSEVVVYNKKDNSMPRSAISGKYRDYVINSHNSFKVMRDMFGRKTEDKMHLKSGLLQLPG